MDLTFIQEAYDGFITAGQNHIDEANAFVNGVLKKRNIALNIALEDNPILVQIAKHKALQLACIHETQGTDSVSAKKADMYAELVESLLDLVTHSGLGITENRTPYLRRA